MTKPHSPQDVGASLRDRASRAAHGALSGLRRPATIACAYALIGISTFGHAAAHTYRADKADYAQCRVREAADPKHVFCLDDSSFEAGAHGLLSALLWPLYWSWEVQQ